MKAKEASGGELTRVQEIIVNGTKRAEAKAQEAIKNEAAQKVGTEILFGNKWIWIIGGVVAFIIVLALLIRR